MCQNCINRWKKEHSEAIVMVTEHLDSLEVPDDSLVRGVAEIQVACNANPMLGVLMREMYPKISQLLS